MTGQQQEPVPEPSAQQRDGVMLVSRLEVAAARLRIATDAKQGKTTPEWVRRLAAATDSDAGR